MNKALFFAYRLLTVEVKEMRTIGGNQRGSFAGLAPITHMSYIAGDLKYNNLLYKYEDVNKNHKLYDIAIGSHSQSLFI